MTRSREHELAEDIITTAQCIVLLLDTDGRILRCNPFMERLTGWTLAELRGRDWFDTFIPAREREQIRGLFKRALGGERTRANVNAILMKDGSERDIEWYDAPLTSARGELIGLVCTGQDVTERDRAESILRESEAQLAAILEQLPVAVGVLDADGRMVRANPRWRRYVPGPIPSRDPERRHRWRSVASDGTPVPPQDWPGAQALRGRPVPAMEFLHALDDGREVWLRMGSAPLRDARGELAGAICTIEDIDALKRGEASLREALGRLEAIVETAPSLIVVTDREGRVLHFNRACEQLTGYRREEMLGQRIQERLLPERWRSEVEKRLAELRAGEPVRTHASPWRTRAGEERLVEWRAIVLPQDGEGGGRLLLAIGLDVTERRRAERALKESEERMRAILEAAADAIITVDRDGFIDGVNAATERMFGFASREAVGKNVEELIASPEQLARLLTGNGAPVVGGAHEMVARRKDGSTFPVDLSVSAVEDLGLFTGILRDVSERKELQRHVLEIAAEEQRRIGQELHDGTASELTSLSLFAGTLLELVEGASPGRAEGRAVRLLAEEDYRRLREAAVRLSRGVTEANRNVHALARGILPAQVDAEGLAPALEELAADTDAQQDVSCDFECSGTGAIGDNATATHLYRIAQEAVNNALRHGRPDRIRIRLVQGLDGVVLEVADDGIGFAPDGGPRARAGSGGMGLRTMDYRAGIIGGVLHIARGEEGGTAVRCTVVGR